MPSDEPPPGGEPSTLLRALAAAGVDFVLVGGLAAVAQGAPLTTFDADIVHARDEGNVDALLAFLARVHAVHREGPAAAPRPPSRRALLGPGHSLLVTDLGPLYCLGAIEGGAGYEELLPESIELDLGEVRVRVLALEALVRLKRGAAGVRDRRTLAVLEETLRRARGG